jgi:ATP-dependent Clp protease ATP-binding subunit ClpB
MLKGYFRPEFLNRVDETIVFHPLGKEQLTKIVDVQLRSLKKRLAQRNIRLVLDDDARQLLADEGYDPQFGARPLKRVIQHRIENPLANKILRGEFGEGDTILVHAERATGGFKFEKATGAEVVEGELVGEGA